MPESTRYSASVTRPAGSWNRRARIKTAVAAAAALVATGAALFVGCNSYVPAGSMAARRSAENSAVAEALGAAGLDAKTLAAAGVSQAVIEDLVGAVRDHLAEHPFSQTLAAHGAALTEVDRLTRTVQSGGGEQALASLTAARATLAGTTSSYDTAVGAISAAAANYLTQAQRTAVVNLRTNRDREVPAKYLTVTRTDEEWVALREALASVRIANARQESPPAEAQSAVTAADGLEATAAAAQGLQNLQAVRSAWHAAVGPI